MTRPKDGSYVPDSNRWPGKRKHTPIPSYRNGQLRSENLEIVQSYKGFALVACKKPDCDAVMIYKIEEPDEENRTIWSCDGCARRVFQRAYPQSAQGERTVYIFPSRTTTSDPHSAAA